jgi:predicted acyltransferase
MFWIIGGEELIRALAEVFPVLTPFGEQLRHAKWAGLHFYDLIFPLFMFISGVAIPYSLKRKLENGTPKKELIHKVVKRAVILIVLGVVYNGGLSFTEVRFASVLGQIGIAYLIAAVIVLNTKNIKNQIIWVFGVMLGYSVIQLLISVPNFGIGNLTAEGSVNAWIDQMILPGRMHRPSYDPEGILCTLSASVMTLTGAIAGGFIRSNKYSGNKNAQIIVASGVLFLVVGLLISPYYPIVKRIWTTPFNLAAGGISLLLTGIFYWIIDVKGFQKWTFFFRVIGLNSITIYLLNRMVNFEEISGLLFGGIAGLTGSLTQVTLIFGLLALEWILLYFLYQRKIFLKV